MDELALEEVALSKKNELYGKEGKKSGSKGKQKLWWRERTVKLKARKIVQEVLESVVQQAWQRMPEVEYGMMTMVDKMVKVEDTIRMDMVPLEKAKETVAGMECGNDLLLMCVPVDDMVEDKMLGLRRMRVMKVAGRRKKARLSKGSIENSCTKLKYS